MTTISKAEQIRSQSDLSLFESLLQDRTVVAVREKIERMEEDTPFRTRRRLLATAVRLSVRMAPDLHKMAARCIEKLGVELPLELFVFASATHNAMCFRPEEGRLMVMFSSSLLEDFAEAELEFVMGHELGHHIYNHHDIPIGFILRGDRPPDPKLALTLFTWSRYAEISADRAGALCAGDIEAVSRSLFKLASGLSGRTIQFNLADFLDQVDQMQVADAEPGAGAPREDWFSTHPFSPLRVKALGLFDRSELLRADGDDRETLENGVQQLMGLMEPDYMEGRTETAEAMRRLLFAGAVSIARADGDVTEAEVEVFEKFFGKGTFSDRLDLDAIEADIDARIDKVNERATPTQGMQVLRDLCLVARAEGYVTNAERARLYRIADGLGVSRGFVCHTMDSAFEPD